jgi:ABC-type phosphate transport system substrate-binding protein
MMLYCAVFVALLSMVAGQAAAHSSTCIQNELIVAGSTTVYPVTVEWAYGYKTNCTQSNITVDWELGGSTVGAKRVCGDPAYAPAQIGTMSRTFRTTEAAVQSDGR